VADPLWALATIAAAMVSLSAALAGWARYGRRQKPYVSECVAPARDYHLPPTIEAGEREMAVLLRRMRAYLRDPYDFSVSRITCETAFDDCLDRAAALGNRIAELGGAAPADPVERARARGLILDSLSLGRQSAPAQPSRISAQSRRPVRLLP